MPTKRKFGFADLRRMALWGLSAAASLTMAIYAGATETGRERAVLAFAEIHDMVSPGEKPVRPLDAKEIRKLADNVRALAADRERLLSRIATLERGVEDVTGSIARVEKAARAPAPETPAADAPASTTPPASATVEDITSSVDVQSSVLNPMSNAVPMPPLPPGSGTGKTEFGLDLGSASSIEALRTAWAAALRRHGPLLEGLHPVVQMRERVRPGGMDLRLIAGPIPNASTAARLCASMTAAGAICSPAVFDGQRLAGR